MGVLRAKVDGVWVDIPPGPQGPQGPQGIQGDPGLAGPYQTYTPTWTAANGTPVVGNGSLVAAWAQNGKLTHFYILLTFGSTTNGSAGAWTFGLPATAHNGGEQIVQCKAFVTGGSNYWGYGLIQSGTSLVLPYLPLSASGTTMAQAQNANSGGGSGTGVPFVSGQYTWTAGTNIWIGGVYRAF